MSASMVAQEAMAGQPTLLEAHARPLAIAHWLLAVAGLVVLIVAVGGITRLTESGLSITEWKPVTGAIPPLTEAQWQAEFAAYRQIPQYIEVTGPAGMTLADYKFIYFWEWLHRLLGRLIGVAFALPLAWFWIRRAIPRGYKPQLLALLAIGGLQGAVGWWMVSSGLASDSGDRVSHFRLAIHLLLALLTLGWLVWIALDMKALARGEGPARMTRFGSLVLAALTIQLLFGALVAGMRAGVVAGGGWFNWGAWPLMQGRLFPDGIEWAGGALAALLNDPYLVHFVHRWWAWVLVGLLIVLARMVRKKGRTASIAIHSAFGVQILLGIAAVWSGVALWLGVAHQLVGALLVAATAWGVHSLGQNQSGQEPARKRVGRG